MGLTRRWLDAARDCDADGWYQTRIDHTSVANLNAEAPKDVAAFRLYCMQHDSDTAKMSDDELMQVREFIEEADRLGKGVYCSH